MVSKAILRDAAARIALTTLPACALVAVGCPDRAATIEISPAGAIALLLSCRSCGTDPNCACSLSARPPPDLEQRQTQARLFLITPHDHAIRDASKCMTLVPCSDAGKPANCLADSLNQQLDGAIPHGLGFDNLKDPDDVQLVLAFYQPLATTDGTSCNRADLVACAGLAPPLGGGSYDISCATCQGGGKNAIGPNNGPCPKPRNGCFLQDCDAILTANSY